jgi:methylated-DNA-[protein]-cysteine S-methyltransferase
VSVDARYYYAAPLGRLYLSFSQGQCCALEYEAESPEVFAEKLTDGEIKHWLDAYFGGEKTQALPQFEIPGTVFQSSVYRLMLQIPYGQTLSYGDAANQLGSAARAVGQACKRNPLPILIPCHRIVGVRGIGGYEGSTEGPRLDRKKWLLNHESRH